MKKERLTYVDTAKFLAIWFVIISHSCMSSGIAHFLFSFHVPLFFILYGYVFKYRKDVTLKRFIYWKGVGKTWIYRVLVPYLLLAFILGNPLSFSSLPFVLYGSIQSLSGVSSTHLWFLPCYFIAVMVYNTV